MSDGCEDAGCCRLAARSCCRRLCFVWDWTFSSCHAPDFRIRILLAQAVLIMCFACEHWQSSSSQLLEEQRNLQGKIVPCDPNVTKDRAQTVRKQLYYRWA